ncbi:ABC transporter ATP-binding protein [Aliiroseovarius sp. 2305UL8-7]|uniref:ABC transporter ATP-binding protein n=1 Tax=Aliiroseovarius conchicola TaxID=3121637 RepID=UPI003528E727
MAIAINMNNLSRRFGDVKAVDNLSLDIQAGEFFTLLGSSGSGKSTLLKMLAGFDSPTDGTLEFDGQDMATIPASKRPCNTVFQDLALFPHMSVGRNVGYGLRVRKTSAGEIKDKVRNVLQLVDLEGYEDRDISALSGGQRQRVALARSLVMEPGILLLDEPLTGLDERLRQQMRDEFGRLHKRTNATFVLVTHNQDEALSLSDRMAIMHDGRLEQIGAPDEILHQPNNEFVARFVGLESIITPEKQERIGAGLRATIAGKTFVLPGFIGEVLPRKLAIRPDRVELTEPGKGINLTLKDLHFRGRYYECLLALGDGSELTAEIASESMPEGLEPGSAVAATFTDGALVPVME